MESVDSMERDSVWIPLTPGKSFPATYQATLLSEQGTGKESINKVFPCIDSFDNMKYIDGNAMNKLPAVILDDGHVAVLRVVEKDAPKATEVVQYDTSSLQEEAAKVPPSEPVHASQDGVHSIPTPSKSKYTTKRRSDDIDLNKKPSQRSRVKKHRPKIFDDSKPKKVIKAQTPKGSTLRPKTPKPATPNRVQERRTSSRKNKFTGSTSYGHGDVVQTVQEASTDSIIDVESCKRFLDFNNNVVDRESLQVSKLDEESPRLSCNHGNFDYFGKIYTTKRNKQRRSRSQKNSLEASESLLEDNNDQPQEEDIYVSRNQEQAKKDGRKYVHFYQRRKKINLKAASHTSTMKVYQRTFRENNCLQNSKKIGPNFPQMFKKHRTLRKKVSIWKNKFYIDPVEDTPSNVRRSPRQRIQIKAHNRVSKSKDKKEAVKKLNRETKECLIFGASPFRRNRSVRHTRVRKTFSEFFISQRMPHDNATDLRCDEKFLPITGCLPLHEVPIHRIDSFTSLHSDVQQTVNSIGNLNCSQLQEVKVLESQSLVPRFEEISYAKEDLDKLLVEGWAKILTRKIASLDINGECKELVVRDQNVASLDINGQCKELVVQNQNVSGALVKIVPSKKRKGLPKVDLDQESLRVWKLLMENDGSEPVEETDKDKEEWWERQREIFRGRVDSFIAKMHLIQGDRRFSPWKGSVTDSVVGVYLTQNVSDHLSSSAFMSVAARFPAKSRTKEIVDHREVASQELVSSYNFITEDFFTNIEMKRNTNTSCADVSDATPIMEPNQDPVSNPTMVACSQDNLFIDVLVRNNAMEQNTSTSCAHVSNVTPILVQDKPRVNGNSTNFRKNLEVEEVDYLKQFCKSDIDGSPPNESRVIRDLSTSKVEGEEQSAISVDFPISNESSATLPDKNTGPFEILSEFIGQQKSTHEEESIVGNPIYGLQSDINVEHGVCAVNNHQSVKKKPLETGSSGKKKSKTEKKQEKKTDWEEVRKTFCKTGSKETDENYMDAVDWDAVRRGTVEELADIIVKRGMNNVLAGKIKDFLDRMYQDHGTLDLEWLRDVPPNMAKEFLLSIEGLGLKSVECIRLLTLHNHAFPVDTNVGRVATRLGWVPLQPLPDSVQIHLLNAYPMVDTIQKYLFPRLCTLDQRTLYELHYQLITFGKVICTKIKPNCSACPMKAECRHYASAVASGRLALPGSEEGSNVTSIIPAENEQNHSMFSTPTSLFDLEGNNLGSSYHVQTCDPIIEVPPSPEPEIEDTLPIIGDIEDVYGEFDDEIPTIQLNIEEFREPLRDTIDSNNVSLPEGDKSKALVALSAEATTFRVPQIKYIAKSRTMHLVYELPDFHSLLAGFDKREHDDPSPYLLRVWPPGELPKSLENTQNRAYNSFNKDQEEMLKGTILIPCRTANRGKFPLNGTYFQVNEVFADDETSHFPIDVPSRLLWNLPTRTLGCGSSASSIFKGLSTGAIQRLFWRGSICVRGFNRKTRQPQPLHRRLYISTTAIAAENRKSKK